MFSDELEKISWEETTKAIYSKTDADVRRALGKKEHLDVNDFMALISPAATPYLEVMARLSQKYTMERFGKTISMFVPLYITNSCTNSCVYCGFHISNPMKRTILTEEEIVNEYKAIKRLAPFENLLLVTGENPAAAGVPYIARALDRSDLLPGDLQQGELQNLSPERNEIQIRMARQRFRPYGAGRSTQNRYGSFNRTGRMAHGCNHVGLSSPLLAKALLEDKI